VPLPSNYIFVSKLIVPVLPFGQSKWAETMTGEYGYGVAVDASGNVFKLQVIFRETVDFDRALCVPIDCYGSADIFISKLNSSGAFLWQNNLTEQETATSGNQ
jgi:hypothetical protein